MTRAARVLAVSVGRGAPLEVGGDDGPGRHVTSAIVKTPVSTLDDPRRVAVEPLGLEGDEQVDRSVHGGPRQAVYVYPFEHYAFWRTVRAQAGAAAGIDEPLPFGSFGENLTVEGLLETTVHVGDTLRVGETVLQVTRPRGPCYKLNARMGFKWAVKMMVQSGFTGFYCAVVRRGNLAAGDEIHLVRGDAVVTIEQQHRMAHRRAPSDKF